MDLQIEHVILKFFIENSDYRLKILPHIKEDYFYSHIDKKFIKFVNYFYGKYNKFPSYAVFSLYIDKEKKFSEDDVKEAHEKIEFLKKLDVGNVSSEWLLEETEKFFRQEAVRNALNKASDIFENKDNLDSIPTIIQEALSVTLDNSIGHDYFEDVDKQFEYYHSDLVKYPTHLRDMNESTGGGFARKTLNVFLGQSGVGKSQMMMDLAAHYIKTGLNVLFISMELSENVTRHRSDANMLHIKMDQLVKIDRETYYTAFEKLKAMNHGQFIVKEYPTVGASVLTFRSLIHEIYNKKGWKPDVIIVDYITCVLPLRPAPGSMYLQGKYVAEELRGMAVEFDAIVFSPAQINRQNYDKLEMGMNSVAESAGIVHVADYMTAICANSETKGTGKVNMWTVKNRLNALEHKQGYTLGYDSYHMRYFDADDEPELQDEYVSQLKNAINDNKTKETKIDHSEITDNRVEGFSEDYF